MTESEAFSLFIMLGDQQNQMMFGYFSVVTAFLIMSHLVAEKLDLFLAYVIGFLFSLCCAWFMVSIYGYYTDIDRLYLEMVEKKVSGQYELEWFGANPGSLNVIVNALQILLICGGWIVSLAYFSYRRRISRTSM